MLGNIYGLDLGTYDIKAYDKKRDEIWKEKTVLAIENEQTVFAVGDEAYKMYEKAPDHIQIVFPMKNGEISAFHDMQYLLQHLLKNGKRFARGSKYIVAVPADVTEVQRRAFYDLVIHSAAKAKEVHIVERGIADAIGCGLDITKQKGLFIANFGGEIVELSVLSYGGLVLSRQIKMGGATLDEAIVNQVRHNHDFLIGKLTAETLRREFGVFDDSSGRTLSVAGRDLMTGVPRQQDISINLVRAAIKDSLKVIVSSINSLIERTPPEILPEIQKKGIFVTGGLANLRGLDTYIEGTTGLQATVAKDPELSAVKGLKEIILSKELQKLAYSMLDENFRWMR